MSEFQKQSLSEGPHLTSRRLTISVPVMATVYKEEGAREFHRRLGELEEGKPRISLGHPFAAGIEISFPVEFSDRIGREIRFRYKGRGASTINDPWYGVDVDFEEGVGVSGEQAQEIPVDLFPPER